MRAAVRIALSTPPRVRPRRRLTPAACERLPEQRAGRKGGVGRRPAAVPARGRRRARRAAATHRCRSSACHPGAVAARVEPGLVRDHGAVDTSDSPGGDVGRECVEVGWLQGRVAEAAQPEVAVPDVADEGAAAYDLRVEPVAGAEQRQRGVGDGKLLVRGRNERQTCVPLEDDGAGAQVDRERGGPRRVDVRHGERLRPAASSASGRRRAPAQRPRAAPRRPRGMGRGSAEDRPGGPCPAGLRGG